MILLSQFSSSKTNYAKVLAFWGLFVFCALLLTLSFEQARAAVTQTVMFRGKVVNKIDGTNISSGNPSCVIGGASNDTCDFRVSIYSDEVGGTQLWYEVQNNIEIGENEGIFNILIGKQCIETLGGTWTVDGDGAGTLCGVAGGGVDWGVDPTLYLELEWDTDGNGDFVGAEVFSRKLLTTVPSAFRAEKADSAISADSATTAGGLSGVGSLSLLAGSDIDDYVYFDTTADTPGLFWSGALTFTNDPGFRVNPGTGELEYRDENESIWTAIDSIAASCIGAPSSSTCLKAIGTGDGPTGTASIYFLDSSSNVTGRYETVVKDSGQTVDFGSGGDGAVTISTAKNINTDIIAGGRSYADGIVYTVSSIFTSSVVVSATPNGIVAGDEVLLINMQGHEPSVGNYEIMSVQSVAGTTINFDANVSKIYGKGNNSDLNDQQIVIQRIPQYTNLTINSGGSLTASAWNGTSGGIVAVKASGVTTVNTGGGITVNNLGYRGGTGVAYVASGSRGWGGESFSGVAERVSVANRGGGSGGWTCNGCGGGTSGASYGTRSDLYVGINPNGNPAEPGEIYGTSTLDQLFLGSGGGGSAGCGEAGVQDGRPGGGIVLVISDTFTINGGTIAADGQTSLTPTSCSTYTVSGGPGSGGSVKIIANTSTLGSSLITAKGGSYYTGTKKGGAGRIFIRSGSISGSTNPEYASSDFYGTLYTGAVSTTAADIAENYFSKERLLVGEVVSFAEEGELQVVKTRDGNLQNLAGVVSTDPGVVLGEKDVYDSVDLEAYPIALAGRVPVRIDPLSRPFKVGDFLGPSSTSGTATKVENGLVLGRALEDWSSSSEGDTVLVFLDVGWAYGSGDPLEKVSTEIEKQPIELSKEGLTESGNVDVQPSMGGYSFPLQKTILYILIGGAVVICTSLGFFWLRKKKV